MRGSTTNGSSGTQAHPKKKQHVKTKYRENSRKRAHRVLQEPAKQQSRRIANQSATTAMSRDA